MTTPTMPTPEPPADNTGWQMTTIRDGFGTGILAIPIVAAILIVVLILV